MKVFVTIGGKISSDGPKDYTGFRQIFLRLIEEKECEKFTGRELIALSQALALVKNTEEIEITFENNTLGKFFESVKEKI